MVRISKAKWISKDHVVGFHIFVNHCHHTWPRTPKFKIRFSTVCGEAEADEWMTKEETFELLKALGNPDERIHRMLADAMPIELAP